MYIFWPRCVARGTLVPQLRTRAPCSGSTESSPLDRQVKSQVKYIHKINSPVSFYFFNVAPKKI